MRTSENRKTQNLDSLDFSLKTLKA